jgi:hypothetical protein
MNFFDPTKQPNVKLPQEVVSCPCNIEGVEVIDFIQDEFPFWGIEEIDRKLCYGFANGVVAAVLRPALATKVFNDLNPVNDLLFRLLDHIERAYDHTSRELGGSPVAHVSSLGAFLYGVTEKLGKWNEDSSQKVDESAWLGFSICLGIVAQQRGLRAAQGQIEHFKRASDEATPYLCLRVLHFEDGDGITEIDPMTRYIAYCYRLTQLEGPYLANLLAFFTNRYAQKGERIDTKRLVNDFHEVGKYNAQRRPQAVKELIDDINTHLAPDCSKQNAEIITRHLGPNPQSWTPQQVWEGGLSLMKEQSPHLLDLQCRARRVHEIALTQRLLDFALWSGFYAGRPDAFTPAT